MSGQEHLPSPLPHKQPEKSEGLRLLCRLQTGKQDGSMLIFCPLNWKRNARGLLLSEQSPVRSGSCLMGLHWNLKYGLSCPRSGSCSGLQMENPEKKIEEVE